MNDVDKYIVTIHLVHGDSIKFEVINPNDATMTGLSEDMEKAQHNYSFEVHLDDKLIIIPYNNIRFLECIPAPDDLPYTILRGKGID